MGSLLCMGLFSLFWVWPGAKAAPRGVRNASDRQPGQSWRSAHTIRHSLRMISHHRWKSDAVNTWPLSEMISMSAAPPLMLKKTCWPSSCCSNQ